MKEKPELDADFTPEEHAEFEKLEAENPYREIPEEPIRIPERKGEGTATKNDLLYLLIFIILMALFLVIILFSGVL